MGKANIIHAQTKDGVELGEDVEVGGFFYIEGEPQVLYIKIANDGLEVPVNHSPVLNINENKLAILPNETSVFEKDVDIRVLNRRRNRQQ